MTYTEPKKMKARFAGNCPKCRQPIAKGDSILFLNRVATHEDCDAAPEPTGDLALVVDTLEKLESEDRLSGFTRGMLDNWRKKGTISEKQIACILRPQTLSAIGPESVPAGRYALATPEGDTYFVRVWRGTRNPAYVKCYLMHGPNESPVGTQEVLKRIQEAGPADAAIAYGKKIGKCCVCDIRLTNELSRELGIGPVCGGRFYDDVQWGIIKRATRDKLRKAGIDPDADVSERQLALNIRNPGDKRG